MTFDEWWDELVQLAEDEDVLYLLSTEPEDHVRSYYDGMTPVDELDEQKSAAVS